MDGMLSARRPLRVLRNRYLLPLACAAGLCALLVNAPEARAQGSISGTVLDARTLAPLSSAQVSLPELALGTITNAGGQFLLVEIPEGTHELQVQVIGYGLVTREVTVEAGSTIELQVALTVQALSLDEIVVTGTAGQARRREIGNTVAQLDMSEVVEPVASVESLLQGRAAGVNVTMASGQAGEGARIRLRGNVSASLSNQPLIYVDGVRVRSDGYPNVNPITGGQQYGTFTARSPLNDINPADIARIEIIKGAAATTLYGTEAAAGVIQIFTKRGETGAPQWNLQIDQGVVTKNKFGFRETLRGTPIEDFDFRSPTGGTPPYNFLDPWLQNGWRQSYQMSVRGGSDRVRYFVSADLERNDGLVVQEQVNSNGIRGNVSIGLTDDLNFDWNTSYNKSTTENVSCGNNVNGLCLNAFRAPNNYIGSGTFEDVNRLLDAGTTTTIGRLVTGGTVRFQPFENLSSQLTLGYDRADLSGRLYFPFDHIIVASGNQHSTEHTAEILSLDFATTYAMSFGERFGADFSGGFQSITNNQRTIRADAEKFPGPGLPTLSSGAITLARESRERVITGGFFGQAVLKAYDRYFLTLGLRVDGNSAFGEDFGFQRYPKVSGSWVVSDEGFWPESLGTLRLRAAYGEAGRAPGAFDAVRTWSPISWGSGSAFLPLNPGNPGLGPERSREVEAGFESALFNGRLLVDLTAYQQRTSDALLAVNTAPSAGSWSSQLRNVGELENEGIELSVDATVIRRPSFALNLGADVGTNHSRVISLGGAPEFGTGGGTRIAEGYSVPVVQGDLILNPDEKAPVEFEQDHFFGPNVPTLSISPHMQFTLPWGVTLTARGDYRGGHFIEDGATTWASITGAPIPMCFDAYEDIEAENAGNLTARERAMCIRENFRSGFYVYPADFFKLRELTLQVPITRFIPRARQASLTLSGRNLYRWVKDDFLAWDPESGGWNSANSFASQIWENPAPGKVFTASVRLSF